AGAGEEVAGAAGGGAAEGRGARRRNLDAGVPVLIARGPATDIGIAVGDAAASTAAGDEAGVQRRIEKGWRRVRRHTVVPVVGGVEAVRAREARVGREAERAGAVARARAPAHPPPARVVDARG